jgi:hypothetical protein
MLSIPISFKPRSYLAACALALTGGAVVATSVDAATTTRDFRCISARFGWKYCKTMDFAISRCRIVAVKNLDSGNNRWIKVQVRRLGERSPRWQSRPLIPGKGDIGRVAGTDRFIPTIWVDAGGLTRTATTMRIRFSGC